MTFQVLWETCHSDMPAMEGEMIFGHQPGCPTNDINNSISVEIGTETATPLMYISSPRRHSTVHLSAVIALYNGCTAFFNYIADYCF